MHILNIDPMHAKIAVLYSHKVGVPVKHLIAKCLMRLKGCYIRSVYASTADICNARVT